MSLSDIILAESNILYYFPLNDSSAAVLNDLGPLNLDGTYDSDVLLGVTGIDGMPGGAVKFGEPTNLGQVASPAYHANLISNTITVEFCYRCNRRDFIADTNYVISCYGYSGPEIACTSVGDGVGFLLKKHSGSLMNKSTIGPITRYVSMASCSYYIRWYGCSYLDRWG